MWLQDADTNEANNSFDPTPFFNGQYAAHILFATIEDQAMALLQAVSNIKPTDPNAPQEVSLAAKIIALIEDELGFDKTLRRPFDLPWLTFLFSQFRSFSLPNS
jgi:hypothetical protein